MEKESVREITRDLYSPFKFLRNPGLKVRDDYNEDEQTNLIPLFIRQQDENCVCSDIYSLLQFFHSCGYEGVCNYNRKTNYLICKLRDGIGGSIFILSKTEPEEITLKILVKTSEGVKDEVEDKKVIERYRSCIFYTTTKRKIMEFKVDPLIRFGEMYLKNVHSIFSSNKRRRIENKLLHFLENY